MATKLQLAWLGTMIPAARTSARLWKVPASVTLAQCILESAWGTSQLSREACNYFGIKAEPGQDYAEFPTHEVVKGRTVAELAKFAKYGTKLDCFAAHAHLLASLPRYASAMAHCDDPAEFAGALHACGYSTLPTYGQELYALIRQHNLTQQDLLAAPVEENA